MIIIEQAYKQRNCYSCGNVINKGEHCARIYGNTRTSRSYCSTCLIQSTVALIMAKDVTLDKESEKIIKESYVEVSI
jgi:hypothetical protein